MAGNLPMSQVRDLRARRRTNVLVGTVVSPTALAKTPTYICSALTATVTLASEADTRAICNHLGALIRPYWRFGAGADLHGLSGPVLCGFLPR
jgi:hypothetical protein